MCFWNARSINNKTVSMYDFLSSNKCDVMALAETWLHKMTEDGDRNQVVINNILPDNYSIKHVPRPDGRDGGGVGLIYSNHATDVKDISEKLHFKQFESISVLLNLKNNIVCLSTVYRPQPTKKNKLKVKLFWRDWTKFLTYHVEQNYNFVIVGDLNFHLDIADNIYTTQFNSLLSEFGVQQLINDPTRIHGHTVDVLITPFNDSLVTTCHVSDLGFINDSGIQVKDHLALKWTLKGERKKFKLETRKIRKWRDIDLEAFKQDVRNCVEQTLDDENQMNLVDWYNSTLSSLVDKYAPEKTVVLSRKPNPWYSEEIRDCKRNQRQLERKWLKTKLTIDHEIFRKQCTVIGNKVRVAQLNFNKKAVAECGRDQKKLYSVANRLLGKEKEVFPKELSDKHCADKFMKFFSNKVKNIHCALTIQRNDLLTKYPNILDSMTKDPTSCFLERFAESNNEEISKIIGTLSSKQCELDPAPTWLVKSINEIITPVVKRIVNTSLSTGIIPSQLKTAVIRPTIKGPSLDTDNYSHFRPVSNLPVLGKIIEKVVYSRLTDHINENNLYGKTQSAYRKYHSTETALLKVQNDILLELDKGKHVGLVMVDVSAAFDTVEHPSLLARFKHDFGLRGKALEWFTSYLTNRKHKVAINSAHSELTDILYGFAQGATLAGMCFNCYSKPLNNITEDFSPVDQHNYADDSQTYVAFACKNKELAIETLRNCVEQTRRWMILNHLKINDDKTKVIFFSPKKQITPGLPLSITFGNEIIKPSLEVKNLGIKMDRCLSLETQVNKMAKTAYFHIKRISKIRKNLDIESTKTLVQTLVISRMDYCNSLLVNLPSRLIKKIQRAQNSAARLVARTPKRQHITPVLKQLHWLPVYARISFKVLLQTYKCLNGMAPSYLTELLSTTRALRSNASQVYTLQLRRFKRNKHGKRAFKVAAPYLWNSIPSNIRTASNITEFKSKLKTYLFVKHYGTHSSIATQ